MHNICPTPATAGRNKHSVAQNGTTPREAPPNHSRTCHFIYVLSQSYTFLQ